MENKKLIALLKKRNISQTKLAKVLHTSKCCVNNKLKGRRSFSLEDVRDIQIILGLSNDEVCDIFLR